MFKKTFFQIHWFLGITAGLILSIMGVTGAIYSYEQPIQRWLNPDSYTVKVENHAKLTPAEIYQHFQVQNPEMKINSITVAKVPEEASNINIVKEGARRGYTMMVNPYTAEILPEVRGKDFFQFIQQLHRNLTVGEVGKQITGASTLMLIFFVLSGLYLRWPKKHSFKQWFALKPKLKGRNFLWDLHAVVGTWVVIFYLLLACTGLYWSYDWWRDGMFKVMGVERPQPEMQGPRMGEGKERQGNATQLQQGRDQHLRNGPRQAKEGLKPEQIQKVLTQTWNGFNSQIKRDYSTLTISIPKKADGKVELTFVDAIPQHERARNKAIYDYQNAQIEKIDLYEVKPLNEKIMSSMLPVHRGSFFGPVFQFIIMLAALAMPLFFITGWMLYLKRRKQKKLTLAAKQSGSAIQIDPNATPWLIAYASQTGVSEQLAWRTSISLQEAHQPTTVKSVQQLSEEDLKQAKQVLWIASTYGTGEAPDLASHFEKKLMSKSLDLSHLKYAVLALGSQDYPETYCSFGHRIDQWLQQSGAQQLFRTIEVNNGSNSDIQQWNKALTQATKLDLQTMSIDKVFDQWHLSKRELLNPDSLGAPAFNIELHACHETVWQAGDIAEVQTGNSPERIQKFLDKYQIDPDTPVDSHEQQPIKNILWDRDLTVEVEPFANMEHLLEQLATLPTREYSIASIPSQQVLRLVVRQQRDAQDELGLGSGWLTSHLKLRDKVALRIRNNDSFHLITDNRPIICIGNGTGIAGLMSLIHARVRLDYTENWLIFGERQQAHDFFFKDTIQAWQNTAMLQRIDLAFSRDQAEKVYVHHKLRDHADEVRKWIANDAVIYVCGSIDGMASDVDQALIDILGQDTVEQLRLDGRYRRDVY
ncbi:MULTISPECIES: sulfite reductase flavoprotein subunit alpha [unclassified Acinetobacter]|uniref:PepSY domain-containing protein n=1 Tax=unclassified Acinetobacter TaxID=196816 RepID=UPI0018A98BEB|nr:MULTISPECIES: sulfite reductase flavoprotein subunit alpha [unclassified Acinetobacter]MBJ9952541.1 sulfite reductase flavoprotein subunit alpha [Acinetobacter baumannii]